MTLKNIIIALFLILFSPNLAQAFDGVPENNKLKFQILRDGKPFGTHILQFTKNNNELNVDIDINMKVGLGFITLFRYEHTNIEKWRGDQLVSINSETNDNGDKFFVDGQLKEDSFVVESTKANYETSKNIAASTYWRKNMLDYDRLINTQKGTLQDISVEKKGVDQVEVAGEMVPAEHYIVTLPKRDIHVWYHTETGQWVDLRFQIRGSQIDYRRLTPHKTEQNG